MIGQALGREVNPLRKGQVIMPRHMAKFPFVKMLLSDMITDSSIN